MNTRKLIRFAQTIMKHLILLGIAIFWMYPFIWMVMSSFKTKNEFFANRLKLIPEHLNMDNFVRVWKMHILRPIFLTLSLLPVQPLFLCYS